MADRYKVVPADPPDFAVVDDNANAVVFVGANIECWIWIDRHTDDDVTESRDRVRRGYAEG